MYRIYPVGGEELEKDRVVGRESGCTGKQWFVKDYTVWRERRGGREGRTRQSSVSHSYKELKAWI